MKRLTVKWDVPVEEQGLAKYARVIAQKARLLILSISNQQVGHLSADITETIPKAQPNISLHLKAFKEVGLIQGEIMLLKIKIFLKKGGFFRSYATI